MPYSEQIKKFFDDSVDKKNVEISFNTTFEKAIFYLIDKILNKEEPGVYFIEVPLYELGANDTEKNYNNFCASVLNATGMNVFNRNKGNSNIQILNGDLFFKEMKGQIKLWQKTERGARELFDGGSQAAYRLDPFGNNSPKLLSVDDYEYNNLNGQRAILAYFNWIRKINGVKKIINGIQKKSLIIGHNNIRRTEIAIPCCIVEDQSTQKHTSPMEPFLYLTVDCERVAQLVREKVFDTVICLGDAKFVTGNEWMITTGYFERMIYIGMNKPVSNARNYYSFAVSEMHNWFDSPINQPIIEVQNDEAIDKSINAYKNIIKDLQENRGSLKYPIDSVYNYTFPLSEEIVEKLVDRFDEYLSSNLNSDSDTWRDPILIVYENIMKCLKNGGNKKKLEYLNKLLTDKKKNRFFFIVMAHEKELLIKQGIKKANILTNQAFKSCLKKISSSKNKGNNKFFFFTLSKLDDILQYMGAYSILGEKIIVTKDPKDLRGKKAIDNLREYDKKFLEKNNRKEITGIQYKEEVDLEPITLDDFSSDDSGLVFSGNYRPENFFIEFEDGTNDVLSGSVLRDNLLWSLSDLVEEKEKNFVITYYKKDNDTFEKIWRIYFQDLHEEINNYILLWKDELKRLAKKYPNNLFQNLQYHGWKTSKANFNSLLKKNNDTDFPRMSSLSAIKKLSGEDSPIYKDFKNLLKARKANEKRKELGRSLAEAMYDLFLNPEITSSFIDTINSKAPELMKIAIEKCLVTNKKVEAIKRVK